VKLTATIFAALLIPFHSKAPHYNHTMTRLAWCVSGLESNHNFQANTGNGYYGGYQFSYSTWLIAQRMMRVFYAAHADFASVSQQTAVFNYYEPRYPGAWPYTVRACGG
jgi:resuscitation-promoting factor RpfA